MKKGLFLLLVLLSTMFLFSACGNEEKSLTVYVVETDALYKTALESFQEAYQDAELQVVSFDSYDKMWEQMSAELMGGGGPDVLLFNSLYSKADPYKLSSSGSLLSLSDQVAKLPAEKYYKTILDAGKVKGEQYLLPLSWNIMQAYSSQEKIAEKGYTADLYTSMTAESKALEQEDTCAVTSLNLGRADAMNCFMEIAGNELIDLETGQLVDQKDELKKTADYVQMLYGNFDKIGTISTQYRNDFSGAVSHFTYLVENYPFMNNLRYYQTVYPMYVDESMYFTPFARHADGLITAQVMQYGGINVNTNNEEGAWKLLQYILDLSVSMDYSKYDTHTIYYASVNTEVYEACVQELESNSGMGPGKKVSSLNEEWAGVLRDIPGRIGKTVIPNAALGELIQECMEPYLLGNASYDSCYEALMKKVKLYVNE